MTRGESMRNWRIRRGLSQAKLAELSGINASTISALELDRNSGGTMDTIEILADTLGLSIDVYVRDYLKSVRHGKLAALIAAHVTLGMSAPSSKSFCSCFRKALRDLDSMVYSCIQDEERTREVKKLISNKIRSIVGEE